MSYNLVDAFKWSMASEVAAKAIQPVVFVVLARLLAPEDFGIMTAALMVVGFSQIFWEAGMGKALIQRQEDLEDAANAAFWINVGLGCLIAGLVYVLAAPVAQRFFGDERVAAALRVMTLQIVLGSLAAVPIALLQKAMGFKRLFWVRFLTVGFPGIVCVPLAWRGLGYWALVVGTLTGQAVQVAALWWMMEWRPRLSFNALIAKEMARFGAWVAASGVLTWFYLWADAFIVGMYLGSRELGLYRTGNQLVSVMFSLAFGPMIPVLYSHFSHMNGDKNRLGRVMERVIRALCLVAVPIGFVVFSLSDPLALIIFGAKWEGIGVVIGVMALLHGYSWVAALNGEAYRALGKPSLESIVTASTLVVYLIAYIFSVRYGFTCFLWTRLLLALCALILHLCVIRSVLSISLIPIFRSLAMASVLALLVTQAIRYWLQNYSLDAWQFILTSVVANATVVGAVVVAMKGRISLPELRRWLQEP